MKESVARNFPKPPLLPVIVSAKNGDSSSIDLLQKHYRGYVCNLSVRYSHKKHNSNWIIDDDLKSRLESKLMEKVFVFRIS